MDPFPPMAKVTAVTTLCPHAGPLRFLLSPKARMMSQNKRCFALQMPDRCLNPLVLPRGRMLPRRWGVFRAATATPTSCWALCRDAPINASVVNDTGCFFVQNLGF